ncbi:MAG: pirin family protein [Saprospiraceae bacterium]
MSIQVIPKERQARGAFNGGEIVENKPIGFPREGGITRPYSNLFYWAYAEANVDSTIGLHPHEGFEIMSFVLKGYIKHFDTKLKEWRPLYEGDAQIIRAGSGISHSEFIAKNGAIFQIWFDPNLNKTLQQPATYDDYKSADLPVVQDGDISVKTYIGSSSPIELDTEGLEIQQLSFKKANWEKSISPENVYSLYVQEGQFSINGEAVKADDFVLVKDAATLKLESGSPGLVFMIASPQRPSYPTYAEMMQRRMQQTV